MNNEDDPRIADYDRLERREKKIVECYGTKYRGCHYAKVYEVFNSDGEVDGHAYSARQAKRMIDEWIKEKRVK